MLKMAPIDSLEAIVEKGLVPREIVHVFGPVALTCDVDVQFQDHPPKATPGSAGAVNVTTVGWPLVING